MCTRNHLLDGGSDPPHERTLLRGDMCWPMVMYLRQANSYLPTAHRLAAKSEKRPRNHFRGDGMLAAGTHVSWLI